MWPPSPQPLSDRPCPATFSPLSFNCTEICCCLQVQARLLPYPLLTYADTTRKTDKSGQWNPAKFFQPGNMVSYAFASFTHPVTTPNLQVRSDWCAPLERGAAWGCKLLQHVQAAGPVRAPAACLWLRQGPLKTHCCGAAPGRCRDLLHQEDPFACVFLRRSADARRLQA